MHDRDVALPPAAIPAKRNRAGAAVRSALRSQGRNLGLLVAIAAWFVLLAVEAPFYFNIDNFKVVLLQVSFVGLAALTTAALMIGGNVDLSIGSMFALCATTAALLSKEIDPYIALLCGIAVGGGLGTLNGLLVWRVSVSPLIITLGMLTVYRGVVVLLTEGYGVSGVPDAFKELGQSKPLGLQSPVWFFIVAAVIAWVIVHRTTVGRHIFAIGGNRAASEAAGLNVRRLVLGTFLASGLVVGLAGVLSASRLGTANPTFGVGFELDVITAVILGGVSFAGGEGRIFGVVLAIFLIGNIGNGIIALGLDPAWADVTKGGLLVLAVALDQLSHEQRERYRKALAMRERAAG